MTDWKPSLNPGVELVDLPLTPEEAFVALRLNGATDAHGLSLVTGVAADRVEAALEKLVALGAVSRPVAPKPAGPELEVGEPDASEPQAPEALDVEAEQGREEDRKDEESSGTHRELYEGTLRHLEADERVARAGTAVEPEISALCFDALPAVVHALLDNPHFGPVHARLVASHHHTAAGLEAASARASFAADAGVRRALLRNPQLSVGLMRRLFGGRRLMEQYQLVTSRDLPEQTRRIARELLRARFATAEADERVELILKTEGRCLMQLSGLPIDGKTAGRLCARTFTSTLLVQNISRWAAAPPALIAHLLKQEMVRRSPALRTLLQRHPNAPTEAKR
jgi:hypothetical protein